MREVKNSMERYMAVNGHYPDRSISTVKNANEQVWGIEGGGVWYYKFGACGSSRVSSLSRELLKSGSLPKSLDGTAESSPSSGCYYFVRHDSASSGSILSQEHEYILFSRDEDLLKYGESEIKNCADKIYSSGWPGGPYFCLGVTYQGIYKPGK